LTSHEPPALIPADARSSQSCNDVRLSIPKTDPSPSIKMIAWLLLFVLVLNDKSFQTGCSSEFPPHWGLLHNTFLLMHPASHSASHPTAGFLEADLCGGSSGQGGKTVESRRPRLCSIKGLSFHICSSLPQCCNILMRSMCLYEGGNMHCRKTRFDVRQVIS
ncbi:hypothetical protein INR49_009766, partial [Caranx melampygus]